MANIENSRNSLRRIMHDDKEFSNQSIINVIERFVKSVNVMEETILVPSRLLDRQVGDSSDSVAAEKSHSHHHHHHHHTKKKSSNIRDHLANTDLFNLYSMLNSIKVDLLWGRNGQESEEVVEVKLREQNYDTITTVETIVTDTTAINGINDSNSKPDVQISQSPSAEQTNTNQKGHVRRPSTVSVSSSNSSTSTISDSESEVSSNENDSGIESENQQEEKDRTVEVAKQFRAHLFGLYQSLEQMTEAAGYLTARYQSDMGGGC